MDERRRFQIALGGVAACVLIAALFVSSAPPVWYPAVRAPEPVFRVVSVPDRPAWPPAGFGIGEPAYTARARRRPMKPAPRTAALSDVVAANQATPSTAEFTPNGATLLQTRTPRVVLTAPPDIRGAAFAVTSGDADSVKHSDGHRDPLTGAFVTVGNEVGRGFRTAGRAIKAIF